MGSGFKTGGADLDAIFDPYQAGAKPALTGYRVAAQDLRDRYNPRSEGEQAPLTGYSVAGGDLNQIFAAAGTSTQALVIPFGNYQATSSGSHNIGAGFDLSINPDGTWAITLSVNQGTATGDPRNGAWHNAPAVGVGADYEVRFTASVSINNTGSATGGNYTASTGWLSLSAAQGVSASTGNIPDGTTGGAGSTVSGYWTIEIRKIGGTAVRESACDFGLEAMSA